MELKIEIDWENESDNRLMAIIYNGDGDFKFNVYDIVNDKRTLFVEHILRFCVSEIKNNNYKDEDIIALSIVIHEMYNLLQEIDELNYKDVIEKIEDTDAHLFVEIDFADFLDKEIKINDFIIAEGKKLIKEFSESFSSM